MSKRPKPRKPPRYPSHIVFPKQGAPYPVVEQLPQDQEGLELAVGQKFLSALRHFKGIRLDGLTRAAEPADLACRSPERSAIELQLVEVIDHNLRALCHMRSSYRDALAHMLRDELRLFSGCRVSLIDSGDPPYLPHVDSVGGRECLRILATDIRIVAAQIHTLESKKIRSREIGKKDLERTIGVVAERLVPAGDTVPFEFSWTGGGPAYRTDVPRGLLPDAILSKIGKQYAKPVSASFWLLAYSVDSHLSNDDPDIAESQRLLDSSPHPFDEVWFFEPYAEMELGALVYVWPTKRDG